jgi:hypothetical protein
MTTMKQRAVRELGGEIWAELNGRIQKGDDIFTDWSVETLQATIVLMMSVLARHEGEIIRNDADLPVAPLEESQAD